MRRIICDSKQDLGGQAAAEAAEILRRAIGRRGRASVLLPAGASQFEVLESLIAADGVDWSRITAFHLDEYIGLPEAHPASFRRYVRQRFVERLPRPLAAVHYINPDPDPEGECRRLGALIGSQTIDLALVGIGENGHLAFNDPPADFSTEKPFLVVELDETCRRQQFGEGWFASLDDVPRRAVTISIPQILKTEHLICSVPDRRKAKAVKAALEGPVTPHVPASVVQQHPRTTVYLDRDSSSLLDRG